ncbi:hypothetical protein [Roseovarius pacificus]|uniref:hypothetical protein n=1 Tax=Roseovarius pacificus TaxID=337701 RepID=UPI00403A184A
MASHYIQFSCNLVLKSLADATYATKLLELMRDDETLCLNMFSFDVSLLETTETSAILWLRDSYGDADLDAVLLYVARLAQDVGSKGYWGFEYSRSCSKQQMHEFGGGAFVLNLETGELEAWNATEDWLRNTIEQKYATREAC